MPPDDAPGTAPDEPQASAPGTDPEFVDVNTAAARLGMSARGVRKRLDAGRFPGAVKAGRGWLIPTAALDAAPEPAPGTGPGHPATRDMPGAAIDLAPLAETIAQMAARIEQLASERAAWEARALAAEERAAQLTAQSTAPAAPGEPQTNAPAANDLVPPQTDAGTPGVPLARDTARGAAHPLARLWRWLAGTGPD